MPEFHISSLVVHGLPRNLASIRNAISAIPGAEIPIADASGKMIVTLETESQGAVADALTRISLFDGVMSATLVFHHVDEAE
jgi:nitrate reductase NapD